MSVYVIRYLEVKVKDKWILSKALGDDDKLSLCIMDNLIGVRDYLIDMQFSNIWDGLPQNITPELKTEIEKEYSKRDVSFHCIYANTLEEIYYKIKNNFVSYLQRHWIEKDINKTKSVEELIREIHTSLSSNDKMDGVEEYLETLYGMAAFIGECNTRAVLTQPCYEDYRLIYCFE